MKICYGAPQSDAWLRARCGRITGSGILDATSYLTRKSGDKIAGDSSAKRDRYKMEIISERLTGRLADHFDSVYMQRGREEEAETIGFYETLMRTMVVPVGLVVHEKYDFTAATPDGLVGDEGVLEVKNPATITHLGYVLDGALPEDYVPQVAWQLACTGRRFADFLSRDSRIQDERLRYFYRRTGRDELEWTVTVNKQDVKLTGEAVIDYFTSEVLKLNAEIEYFFAEHEAKPVAPFPVEIITAEGEVIEADDPTTVLDEDWDAVIESQVRA